MNFQTHFASHSLVPINNNNNKTEVKETSEMAIRVMSWNVNSWKVIREKVALQRLLTRSKCHIFALQEPREVAYLPNFATFQKSNCGLKSNAALLIREYLEPECLILEQNIAAAKINLRNNIEIIVVSIYIHSPIDDETRSPKGKCL